VGAIKLMRGAQRVYLALGSNLGRRRQVMQAALRRLDARPGIVVLRTASFRMTDPVGPVAAQPRFLNSVAELDVRLSPRELLVACLSIERSLGRDRTTAVPQGPRSIDLDILLHGQQVVGEPDLVIPHPRLGTRRFVLEPLNELCPLLVPPGSATTIGALLRNVVHG